jgi:hypothetical protein
MEFLVQGMPRWVFATDCPIAWTGLGGSRAIAIAGATAVRSQRPGDCRFVELSELGASVSGSPSNVIFVSASGDHPSLIYVAKRAVARGGRIGVLTLRPDSGMARLAANQGESFVVSPVGGLYVDEFVADANTRSLLSCLRHMWFLGSDAALESAPEPVPGRVRRMTRARCKVMVVIYDDVGKAAATDFAVRATEAGIVCIAIEFHDFVHGSYRIIDYYRPGVPGRVFVFAETALTERLRRVELGLSGGPVLHLVGVPGRRIDSQIWSLLASQEVSRQAGIGRRNRRRSQGTSLGQLMWQEFR